jgi:hypothetical protein
MDVEARRLSVAVDRIRTETDGCAKTGRTHQDADDEIGTIGTDDAHGFDPLSLLRTLDTCGAPVVVMGQVAGIMHGSRELTGDLDLLWDGDPRWASAMADGFGAAEATLTDDEGVPVFGDPAAFALPKLLFHTASASGDCCTPALRWGAIDIVGMLSRCLVVDAGGFRVRYLARPDLIAMRRAVGRPKDLRRAAELERIGAGRCEADHRL